MQVSVVYDHQCPICRRVVTASRLRQRGARLELLDRRSAPVHNVQGQDLSTVNFEAGFVVIVDGRVYHAAEAAHVLAVLTEPTGILFRLFQGLASTQNRSRLWYPVMRMGRGMLLWILRIPKIT